MFIRGAIFTLTKKHGSNKAARNADLRTIFRHLEFKHDNTLNIQCTRLVDVMSRRWNGVKSRDEFVARFSADKATRLDVASRSKHSLGVCQECERFSEWVESFPCKGKGMGKYLPGSAGSPSVETQTTPSDEAAAVLIVCADITNQGFAGVTRSSNLLCRSAAPDSTRRSSVWRVASGCLSGCNVDDLVRCI